MYPLLSKPLQKHRPDRKNGDVSQGTLPSSLFDICYEPRDQNQEPASQIKQHNSRGLVSSWKMVGTLPCVTCIWPWVSTTSPVAVLRTRAWEGKILLTNQTIAKLLGPLCPNWKTESSDQFCKRKHQILPNASLIPFADAPWT